MNQLQQPMQSLPRHYVSQGSLDLSKNKKLAFLLNLGGLFLFLLVTALLLSLVLLLRYADTNGEFSFEITRANFAQTLLGAMSVMIVTILLHELVHALCFWWYTGAWPKFGFKVIYAYAAAPAWYIPRNQHLLITLAPLFVITFVGIFLLLIAPLPWLPLLLFALSINAAGAIGDIVTAGWLLQQPPTAYINDYGDGFNIYAPAES